jgi:hypothetical protein
MIDGIYFGSTEQITMQKLSHRQQAFIRHCAAGKLLADAYIAAGYAECSNRQATTVNAQKLAGTSHIAAAIAASRSVLAAAVAEEDLLSRREAVGILARIAKGSDKRASTRDRIAATAQASKMLGYDAPSKVEVKLEGSLLHKIRNG